jgi:hypothetical protein
MKQRFLKLIVAALGFLLGMSLLGQEECVSAVNDSDTPSEKVDELGNCCVYGPGPTPFGCSLTIMDD